METNTLTNSRLAAQRAKYAHLGSKWLFPVRMENSSRIEWVDTIYHALGKFKAPITQTMWDTCLRTGRIVAATPEEQNLLQRWWTEGWAETPQLEERATSVPCPILQVGHSALGETLELIFPSITHFTEHWGLNRRLTQKALHNIPVPQIADKSFKTAFPTATDRIATKEPYRWILFDPDDNPVRTFTKKTEIVDYLQCGRKLVDVTVVSPSHAFSTGYWLWKTDWGLVPTSPKGVELPHWEKQLPQPIE